MRDKIQKLIEDNANQWERTRFNAEQAGQSPERWGHVVCIAREAGAGASELADALSKRLGFEVYDRKLVQAISERSNIREQLLDSVDEHVRSGFTEFLGDLFSAADAHSRYEHELAQVVLSLAHVGRCIIVGRGATFLIPREHSFCVKLVADRDWRVRRFAEQRALSTAQAGVLLDKTQQERSAFIRKVFGTDPESALHYDLVLNSGTLPLQTVVDLAELGFHGKFPQFAEGHAHR